MFFERLAEHTFPPIKPVSEETLESLRAEVAAALQQKGYHVPERTLVEQELNHIVFTLNKYRGVVSNEVILSVLQGLNERVTNYLTGVAVQGVIVDHNPKYSNSFIEATVFWEFLVDSYRNHLQLPTSQYIQAERRLMHLCMQLATDPSAECPFVPELEHFLSHLFALLEGEEYLEILKEQSEYNLIGLLEALVCSFLAQLPKGAEVAQKRKKYRAGLVFEGIKNILTGVRLSGRYEITGGRILINTEQPTTHPAVMRLQAVITGALWGSVMSMRAHHPVSGETLPAITVLHLAGTVMALLQLIVANKRINYRGAQKIKSRELLKHELVHEATLRQGPPRIDETNETTRNVRLGLLRYLTVPVGEEAG